MDFSNTLFRASGVGHLLTEPKSKKDKDAGNLSEGAKTHLIDCYVSAKYNRQSDVSSKYITKGLMCEEDAITLYSRLKKRFFKKNEDHLHNEYLKGTPDLFEGTDIMRATLIVDVKVSWDIFTFHRVLTKDVNDLYYWQLQAYMALTGAQKATLAYCLIDTPLILLEDEKRKLLYKMGAATTENSDYIQACEELEQLMIYKDIPLNERMIEFQIQRNDEEIDLMYAKIQKARAWLNEFEQARYPEVILAQLDSEVGAIIVNAHE